jgi:hypothetical protein
MGSVFRLGLWVSHEEKYGKKEQGGGYSFIVEGREGG